MPASSLRYSPNDGASPARSTVVGEVENLSLTKIFVMTRLIPFARSAMISAKSSASSQAASVSDQPQSFVLSDLRSRSGSTGRSSIREIVKLSEFAEHLLQLQTREALQIAAGSDPALLQLLLRDRANPPDRAPVTRP